MKLSCSYHVDVKNTFNLIINILQKRIRNIFTPRCYSMCHTPYILYARIIYKFIVGSKKIIVYTLYYYVNKHRVENNT